MPHPTPPARPLSGRVFSCTWGGWGGVGWGGASVNVHVNLQGQWTRLCMCRYVHVDLGGLQLLQKSSQASKTFFQLLQIKRLQLKLTNNLQNSYQISSQHQVPKTWVKQHPKTPKTQKQTKIYLQVLPCTNWFHLVPNWFLPGSYRFLWVL